MKGLHSHAVSTKSSSMSWMKEDSKDLKRQDEIRATTKILLHLIDYMERNQMSQTELAKRLDVTPQYIHKLLHGQDSSFRVETAIEYGKKLGISLIEIPPVPPTYTEIQFSANELISWVAPLGEYGTILNGEIKNYKSKNNLSWKQKNQLAIA